MELLIERAAAVFEPVGDGWTLFGRAVPYGVRQRVTDDGALFYAEEFDPGAFARDVAKGGRWVNLMAGHRGDDGERFLGRAMRLESLPDGLYAEVRLDRSNPLAEQARSGELTGWSVGARVYKTDVMPDGTHRRLSCGINHIAATAKPQYANAGVLTYRSEHVQEIVATPLLDRWRKALQSPVSS